MILLTTITVFTCLLSLSSALQWSSDFSYSPSSGQVQNVLKSVTAPIHLRNATVDDLDDLTDVLIDAFSASPVYDYLFQFRKKYPKFHWECRRQEIERALFADPTKERFLNVIDVPVAHDDSHDGDLYHQSPRPGQGLNRPKRERRVVAFGIWELMDRDADDDDHDSDNDEDETRRSHLELSLLRSLLSASSGSSGTHHHSNNGPNCLVRIDLNYTRAIDYSIKLRGVEEKYITKAYDHQLYLSGLATHPDYDGNGFGAAHCHWGMDLANDKGVVTSLVATPAGYPLYNSLGFASVANISIETVDGDPLSWMEAMALEPTSKS